MIPLHYLDLNQHREYELPSRNFRSTSDVLNDSLGAQTDEGPKILVAQLDQSPQLAAIEKLGANLYSITCFSPKVRSRLFSSKTNCQSFRGMQIKKSQPASNITRDGWEPVTLSCNALSSPSVQQSRPSLELETQENEGRVGERPAGDNAPQTEAVEAHLTDHGPLDRELHAQTGLSTPLGDVAIILAQQYLETLYLSKTSLAYFTKGTLARTRTAVGDVNTSIYRTIGFLGFIKDMVLSVSTFDRKHRKVIPEIIAKLSTVAKVDGKCLPSPTRPQTSRKLKKAKPSKNGLYSIENDALKHWLNRQECDSVGRISQDQIKAALTKLRFREILLQIILVMEVLAIEQQLYVVWKDEESSDQPIDLGIRRVSKPETCTSQRPLQMENALETFADRVCIWQSIEAEHDGVKKTKSKAEDESEAEDGNSEDSVSRDQVRDFYHDVLIPFYASRVPVQVKELGRKFGITKSSFKKIPSSLRWGKIAPGTDLQEQHSLRKNVQDRYSPNISKGGLHQLPLLHHRVTNSPPGLNACESKSISSKKPIERGKRILSRASSNSTSTKLRQREVDMTSIARFNESRFKTHQDLYSPRMPLS